MDLTTVVYFYTYLPYKWQMELFKLYFLPLSRLYGYPCMQKICTFNQSYICAHGQWRL